MQFFRCKTNFERSKLAQRKLILETLVQTIVSFTVKWPWKTVKTWRSKSLNELVFQNKCSIIQARSQDLEKGGGDFERVRSLQTTLTRIFIVLESVSHGLSENWCWISRKFKRFFRPKSGDLQKKKRSSPILRLIFRPKSEIQTFEGGLFSYGGGYFQYFTKNRPQNHQKGAILHTSQANGGDRAPRAPPLATLLVSSFPMQ